MANDQQRGEKWRKFSRRDVFALMVCYEIRKRLGIPVSKLKFVSDFMKKDDTDHFDASVRYMNRGLTIFLLTDFEDTFIVGSDIEFEDLMTSGCFRADHPQAYVFLRLNDIVNRLLSELKEPELKPCEDIYEKLHSANAQITACTVAEMKVLDLLRQRNHDQITIRLKDGKITRVETEGEVPVKTLDEPTITAKHSDFETVTITREYGKVIRARRKTPLPVADEQNDRLLFTADTEKHPKD